MDTAISGISIHHALGGRPLWLVVLGARNSTEAQAAATIAGHRLHRVLGGFSLHFPLESDTSAFAMRLNEVVVVGTYYTTVAADADTMAVQIAVNNCRNALIHLCGGHVADVTLLNLSKQGGLVQLALRKAAHGFGKIAGVGNPKFDFGTVQISPDPPPDDAAATAVRAANDITAASLQAAADAYATAFTKLDTMIDSVTSLRYSKAATDEARATSEVGRSFLVSQRPHTFSRLPTIPPSGLFFEQKADPATVAPSLESEESESPTRFTRPAHELSRPWAPAEDEEESDEEVGVVLDQAPLSDHDEEEEEEDEGGERHGRKGVGANASAASLDAVFGLPAVRTSAAAPQDNTLANAFDSVFASATTTTPAAAPVAATAGEFDIFGVTLPAATPAPASAPAAKPLPSTPASVDFDVFGTVSRPPTSVVTGPQALSAGDFDVFGVAGSISSTSSSITAPSSSAPAALSSSKDVASSPDVAATDVLQGGSKTKRDEFDIFAAAPTDGTTASGSKGVEADSASSFINPAPIQAPIVCAIKLAAQVTESISVAGKPGGEESVSIDGTIALKYIHATAPPAQFAAGHSCIECTVTLASASLLKDVVVVDYKGNKVAVESSGKSVSVPLRIPERAPAIAGNPAIDVGSIQYRYDTSFQPHIVKVAASAKPTFAPDTSDGASSHKFTDILLKSMLHPSVVQPTLNTQFLVQLPPVLDTSAAFPGLHRSGDAPPSYAPSASLKPQGLFNAPKAQLMWSLLADGAPLPAGIPEENAPRTLTYFAAGKAAELKARVPIVNGVHVAETFSPAIMALPVQLRFGLPTQALFAPTIQVSTSSSHLANVLVGGDAHRVELRITGCAQKSSSMFKENGGVTLVLLMHGWYVRVTPRCQIAKVPSSMLNSLLEVHNRMGPVFQLLEREPVPEKQWEEAERREAQGS